MYTSTPTTKIVDRLSTMLLYMLNRRACIFLVILALGMLFSSSTLLANEKSLLIVTGNHHPIHHLFVAKLKSQLANLDNGELQLKVISVDDWQVESINRYPLTLALGNKAAIKLSQHKLKQPVLFSLLPSTTYDKTVTSNKICSSTQCSAIYIDQPIKRTLQLAHLALPKLKATGILTSHKSSIDLGRLSSAAQSLGLAIEHQQLISNENLVFTLRDILKKSDALLSLPDPNIYSSRTVQNILLTAYRHRKPVIGYSRAFVKAGALFAVYTTPSQLSQQTAEVISQFFSENKKTLPEAQYPRYFTVSVNTMVAKSLGINIDTEDTLQEKLEAASHE